MQGIPKPENITLLRASLLAKVPFLLHAFSTRAGGFSECYGGHSLNLGFTKEDHESSVKRNRRAFLEALSWKDRYRPGYSGKARTGERLEGDLSNLVTLRQLHSDLIHYVAGPPQGRLAGDGVITDVPGLLLAIQSADCLPVLLVDPKRRAVGVFHAGWRGTLQGIVEKGVGKMRFCFGSRPRDLKAAIGPGIHRCCYQVGEEIRRNFESQFVYAGKLFREVKDSDPVREKYPLLFLTARAPGHGELPNKIFLDLVEANRRQLIEAGLAAKNIEASPLCTNCRNDLLFSHRAEKGKTGRMMAVAGIRRTTR